MSAGVAFEYVRADTRVPPSPVWEFSPLDRACSSMVIRGSWLFDGQLDVESLKRGLQAVLTCYPHLAGRMEDKSGIHLVNEGVPFAVAHDPDVSVADVGTSRDAIRRYSVAIQPPRIKRGVDAPLSVMVTRLRDGTALGVQCFHACMDGESFYTMVHNWGMSCRGEEFEPPLLDQSLAPAPGGLSRENVDRTALEHGWKRATRLTYLKLLPTFLSGILKERTEAFYFSAGVLDRLRQRVSDESGFGCSTNVALSALLCKMLIGLHGHGDTTECVEVTTVNGRTRLAGIPSNFVGNASVIIVTPPFPAGSSVGEIARVIEQTLKPIHETPSEELRVLTTLSVSVMSHGLSLLPFDVADMYSARPTAFQTNNFSGLHIYDVDFGAGAPVSVIPHDLSDQVLIWPAPPVRGGLEVYFAGVRARTIRKLREGNPWLEEMRRYAL